jgi:N-glycosylase/DNA lyase
MFLRNIGLAFDLAILDRHLLKYAAMIGIAKAAQPLTLTYRRYCEIEEELRTYAATVGWPIGYLDWAVWIVMSAARAEARS